MNGNGKPGRQDKKRMRVCVYKMLTIIHSLFLRYLQEKRQKTTIHACKMPLVPKVLKNKSK